jgi:hypothetical protein
MLQFSYTHSYLFLYYLPATGGGIGRAAVVCRRSAVAVKVATKFRRMVLKVLSLAELEVEVVRAREVNALLNSLRPYLI